MRPKGMENLAAFSTREVKKAAAKEERETTIPLQKDIGRKSHPKELSEN